MLLLVTLLIFLLTGILILFKILELYVQNLEKAWATPVFVFTIAGYMCAALLLGRYLPGLL